MSFKQVKDDSSSRVDSMIENAVSLMGPLEQWEREELEKCSIDFGRSCYDIANMKQTSNPRIMKWLKMSAEEGYKKGMLVYSGLLHGLNPDLKYKRDEAAWWVKRVKDEKLVKQVGSFDSDGSRGRRHVVRTLLSGSLSKNQDLVIYRSFFRSGLREVHLLPLISKYLVEEKREKSERREVANVTVKAEFLEVKSLLDISSIVFSPSSSSSFTSLTINMKYDNQFLCFLPLLFSLLPNLKALFLDGCGYQPHIDFSFFQQVNTSKLEILVISYCSFDSLSPLSLCDLSSLHSLRIESVPERDGLQPLNGLSSDITRSLKELKAYRTDLKDLSPLSDCDLSSLEELHLSFNVSLSDLSPLRGSDLSSLQSLNLWKNNISDLSPLSDCDLSSLECLRLAHNRSLSDLSPLRGSDLSSLKSLNLDVSNISDLSPLCECKGLALEDLSLFGTPIEDLSPLSLLDLSRLREPIGLNSTEVSDLSPLENISYDGVEVNICDTPAKKRMEEKGLRSPQTIGKVKVMWRW